MMQQAKQFLTVREASRWASDFLKRNVSESNISYLVQYGKVRKHNGGHHVVVDLKDLKNYYDSYHGQREISWKKQLGSDLNWALSFDHLCEKDTTKHVHRLHPYKGKFIPQLVEYFVDGHVDNFKTKSFFKKGDILLDPFAGSGTTLIQARELGLHSIGIDISQFNCMIAGVKAADYDLAALERDIYRIRAAIADYEATHGIKAFEQEISEKLTLFNKKYFPSPSFKYEIEQGRIDEAGYATKKSETFLAVYKKLVEKYGISLSQPKNATFLDQWYIQNVRKEIDFTFTQIKEIRSAKNKKALALILSRTMRSCRATTHSDLGTLKQPQWTTYYCWKHKKICKPLFSIKNWFDRYALDTLYRLKTYERLKSDSFCSIIAADSRKIDLFKMIEKRDAQFYRLLRKQKIKGIFTSPPYVGQIDYHEQHAYAYDLFGFRRRDELEIGPLYKGKGVEARMSYVDGISEVLLNCKKFLINDFDIFIVANDRHNLYPVIAERSGLRIVNQFKRPVLNRTERDKAPYSEIIFHLKG